VETGLKQSSALVIVACLVTAACDQDPARSVKIVARPPAAASSAVTPPGAVVTPPGAVEPSRGTDPAPPAKRVARPPAAAGAGVTPPGAGGSSRIAEWRPEGCPPPPEDSSGPSSLSVTGPCAFQHRARVNCEARADDFYVSLSRKAARGATLMVYINVEKYHGPGSYDGAEMFVGVQDKTSIYRWSGDRLTITVGPGEEFVVLPTTRLDAEPILIDCTGPMTNFQCGGRGDAEALLSTTEVVSGTLWCEGGAKEK